MQQYNVFSKGIIQIWILYLWILKIVKYLIFTDNCSILQIKKTWEEKINILLYQILAFTIHGKKIKRSYNNSKFKISAPTWNKEFELPDGLYSISDIQEYFEYILKNHRKKTILQ